MQNELCFLTIHQSHLNRCSLNSSRTCMFNVSNCFPFISDLCFLPVSSFEAPPCPLFHSNPPASPKFSLLAPITWDLVVSGVGKHG